VKPPAYTAREAVSATLDTNEIAVADLTNQATQFGFWADVDGRQDFARCTRHAAIGHQSNSETTVL
jgi:hypothetical protein